jgi:hypothetical protein
MPVATRSIHEPYRNCAADAGSAPAVAILATPNYFLGAVMENEFRQCPCGCTRFAPGPRGGLSWNVTCVACGARFNILLEPGCPVLLINDLPGGKPPVQPSWIIELESQ